MILKKNCLYCNKEFNYRYFKSSKARKFCSKNCAANLNNMKKCKEHSKILKQKYANGELPHLNSGGKTSIASGMQEARKKAIETLIKNGKPHKMYNTRPELQFESKIQNKLNYIKQEYVCGCPIDFYIPSLKLCIFIDGDYWHCNPKIYSADYYHSQVKMTAKEIWIKDENITRNIIDNGYLVLRIWESDLDKLNIEEKLKELIA